MQQTAARQQTVEAFYVILIIGRRRSTAAGPYPTRKGAERVRTRVRTMIDNLPEGERIGFYLLQIGTWTGPRNQAPQGKFNRAGLIPKGRI